ncbi:FHA domain-containing protein [Mycobacterium uberis]|nr:FHA domain-containing protein [Mycobacterium uberis]
MLSSKCETLQKPVNAATSGLVAENWIVISNFPASRYHAFLTRTPLSTEIRDTHNVNGTFVNGLRVGYAVLSK